MIVSSDATIHVSRLNSVSFYCPSWNKLRSSFYWRSNIDQSCIEQFNSEDDSRIRKYLLKSITFSLQNTSSSSTESVNHSQQICERSTLLVLLSFVNTREYIDCCEEDEKIIS